VRVIKRPATAVALAALLGAAPAAAQTTDAQKLHLRALAATCANCHGTEGQTVANSQVPKLTGLPREYIVTQMNAFRDGTRQATVMHQLVKGYTPSQIEALALYFGAK
jgi:cytochrome subunit of sulfide dehydrogenase